MFGRTARIILLLQIILVSNIFSKTEIELVGKDIPRKYFHQSKIILTGSDSVYLNGNLLIRNSDYKYNSSLGYFDLSKITVSENDTLFLSFMEMPQWLLSTYGKPLPEIIPSESAPSILPSADILKVYDRSSDVKISGSKTFRVTSRSSGSSAFSQSLDLNLAGNLSDNLKISGTISDRGFNPAYGTANSRIEELDKINLKLSSLTFTAEVGDIVWQETGRVIKQRVSGASMKFNNSKFGIDATAARPKGRFESVKFYGQDGRQGPYQIVQEGRGKPLLPASERVWLDGELLTKGAHHDYIMDYSAGRITFNVNHPIDSRNRIEIDYEPVLTDFKGELFSAGSMFNLGDSLLSFKMRWIREGDDKDELQLDFVSDADKLLLESIGDNSELALTSGVRSDSLGSYVLVLDSLPDSVFKYVGEGLGDYSIHFSFVGTSSGSYRYLGSNRYEYSGPGNGDYLPVILIAAPVRTDYYLSEIGFNNNLLGRFNIRFNQSSFDKNLLSSLDDDDNNGLYYSINHFKKFNYNTKENTIAFNYQKKEIEYKNRQRLTRSDLNWKYHLPVNYKASTDETIYTMSSSLALLKSLIVTPDYSSLSYKNSFNSDVLSLATQYQPIQSLIFSANLKNITSTLDSPGQSSEGEGEIYKAGIKYLFHKQKYISASFETDTRENDYSGMKKGTRFRKFLSVFESGSENIKYEYFNEDSLISGWQESLKRNRISMTSSRQLGRFDYNAIVSYQHINKFEVTEENILSRFSFQYRNLPANLNFSAVYALSEETRNSRGVTYLKVEDGRGGFIFEDSIYIPDENGDYIKLDEILSDQSRVRRMERSFNFNKTWSSALLRIYANINEELPLDKKRNAWWLIPFYYNDNQEYFFNSRNFETDLRLIPIKNAYFINLKFNTQGELRTVSSIAHEREESKFTLQLKESVNQSYFEQKLELFENKRDLYFNGSNGDIKGYRFEISYLKQISRSELKLSGSFRKAESTLDDISKQTSLIFSSRVNLFLNGELRSRFELYSQNLTLNNSASLYLLTENRTGDKGAVWTIAFNYGIKNGLRLNFSIFGRHADNRTARITGRTELIAGF